LIIPHVDHTCSGNRDVARGTAQSMLGRSVQRISVKNMQKNKVLDRVHVSIKHQRDLVCVQLAFKRVLP